MTTDTTLYRNILTGGDTFVDNHLSRFSLQEDWAAYQTRKAISYAPGKAKACCAKIALSILDRLGEVTRTGGDASYSTCAAGLSNGIDGNGKSVQSFLSDRLLELLVMGRMAFVVDKAPVDVAQMTLSESKRIHPYVYSYTAEEIVAFAKAKDGTLTAIRFLCLETEYDDQGLPDGTKDYTVTYTLPTPEGPVLVYDSRAPDAPTVLALSRIPVILYDETSLISDAARHEVALLNLASADLHYSLKSNFPFYTQQTDISNRGGGLRREAATVIDSDGTNIHIQASDTNKVGPNHGVEYPKGLDRPGFIAPPTEPLIASMALQSRIENNIEDLIYLALKQGSGSQGSGSGSQGSGSGTLDAGLTRIGLALQHIEQQIANLWAAYQGTDAAIINYPDKYTLRSQEDRLKESAQLLEQLPKFATSTGQREIAVKAISLLLIDAGKEVRDKIVSELRSSDIVSNDPDQLRQDHEAGILSTETACRARLYPEGEAERAKADHIERMSRIVKAQSKLGTSNPDTLGTSDQRDNQKELSQDGDHNMISNKDKVRGQNKDHG